MDYIRKITLIGAGNVATQLGLALVEAGFEIQQVFSRTRDAAAHLARMLDAGYTNDLSQIRSDADLYIVSVSDDAVQAVLSGLSINNGLIVHTSGSLTMDVLHESSGNYGVLYPLQTFSKGRKADFTSIPICIEASSARNLELIRNIARKLSPGVHLVNSHQRKILHLAAVFACNFPNFMFSVAEDICGQGKVDFNLLKPLIVETAAKILEHSPADVQTGPAKRNDQKIMNQHLDLLSEFPQYQSLYESISGEINKKHFKQ